MLREVIRGPEFALAALRFISERVADRRAVSPSACSEPAFLRLESQLRALLAGDDASRKSWYASGWKRLFSVLRRSGPLRRRANALL
ncbi:MAG: hypothetical protein AAB074_05690 [Planctomycetota bacterium]